MTEFPEELVERCVDAALAARSQGQYREVILAVLREARWSDLVAALKMARDRSDSGTVIAEIEEALRKAGAL